MRVEKSFDLNEIDLQGQVARLVAVSANEKDDCLSCRYGKGKARKAVSDIIAVSVDCDVRFGASACNR